jgi:hypothetical protein
VHCCTSHLHLCSQEGVRAALTTTAKLSPTRTLRADPHSEQQVQSKVSLRRAVDAVYRGVSSNRPSRRSGTTCKQPANLEVEAAEESLSIIPDYTPTVRPPPKRC